MVVAVTDAGKSLLNEAAQKSNAMRNVRADFEARMRAALEREQEEVKEALAVVVAKMLDDGIPKAQIAKACGYKNYHVSLKDIDARAQKYRGVLPENRDLPVPHEVEAKIEFVVAATSPWTEPNSFGEMEQEIVLQFEKGDAEPVWVTVTLMKILDEDGVTESASEIVYVNLPENPFVNVAYVNAIESEILEAVEC